MTLRCTVVVDAGIEIESKRLELLREAVPSASRVAYLAPRSMWESSFGTGAQVAGRRIGVSVVGVPIESPAGETEYRRAFAWMSTDAPDALFVADTEENLTYRRLIVELAREARLPTFYPFREFVAVGGLMTYAVDLEDLARHAAAAIHAIFRGAKPGDIPFWQPSAFSLAINLKTAAALGLTIPPTLIARADEVIE